MNELFISIIFYFTLGENALLQQKLSNSTTCVSGRRSPNGNEGKKTFKRRGKRYGARRAQRKATQPLLFRHWPPFHTALTRSSIARPRFFLPWPSFYPSPHICRLRPPPKLQPFLVLIGVYGLVRPGKQRSLFSLRCLLLCCWWCGFCPFLGVQCVPPFLENAPRWAALFALGCRLSLDSEASALGLGRAPLSRRGIWCGLMASCEDSATQ